MEKKSVLVLFDIKDYEELKQYAESLDRSLVWVVRDMVKKALREDKGINVEWITK